MRGHLVIALVLGGCSLVHVEKPSRPSPARPPACDPDSAWPLVDGAIAIGSYTGMIVGLAWVAYADPESDRVVLSAGVSLLALGLSGWVWSWSSMKGDERTYECAALHARQAR